jgi:hypothetical protein
MQRQALLHSNARPCSAQTPMLFSLSLSDFANERMLVLFTAPFENAR